MAMAGRSGMTTAMRMAESADRLRLVQKLSPAFPIGSFAYSQGLETAMATGEVSTAGELREWVSDILTRGSGRLDAVFVARARDIAADPDQLADLAYAYAPSAERALELREQGRAFSALCSGIDGIDRPPLPYPVAVGLATRHLAVSTAEVVALWMMGLANQLVSAAVRFIPLGQTEGQSVLAALAPLVAILADELANADIADIAATTPGADLAAMHHETLSVRIFRT